MKKTAVFLLALCVVCLCTACIAEGGGGLTFAAPSALEQPQEEQGPWTYPISRAILEDPMDVLRLVNKQNLLDKDYPPKDDVHALVTVTLKKTSSAKLELRKIAHDALAEMFAAAEADGIKLYVKSAYRSYSTQKTMYYNRLKDNNGKDDGVVQLEGASEHQTGLAVDVLNWEWRDKKMNTDFAKTKEAQWMAENCTRFGFIIRYSMEKQETTGITYEPWHLRYVGVEAAEYITQKGLSLEEFTEEWQAALRGEGLQEIPLVEETWNTKTTEDTFNF